MSILEAHWSDSITEAMTGMNWPEMIRGHILSKYIGKRKEYHFYEKDCQKISGYGYAGLDEKTFTAIFFEGLKDVIIDLNGAKLIFHGRIAPFVISKCYNVVMKNFSIDYDRPFYTQGDIIKRGEGFIDLKQPLCDCSGTRFYADAKSTVLSQKYKYT